MKLSSDAKIIKQVHTIIRCIPVQGLQGKSADHFGSLGSFANRGRVMYMQKLIELPRQNA